MLPVIGKSADFSVGRAAYYSGDMSTAYRELEPLAAQGDANAQLFLGFVFQEGGDGFPKNYDEAFKWYSKAVNQDGGLATTLAQGQLGQLYNVGLGVAQDYAQALKWYKKAAERGDSTTQYRLGLMYYSGNGVLKDYDKAKEWYVKSAAQGNPIGTNLLGGIYIHPETGYQDFNEGIYWLKKAADLGDATAQLTLAVFYMGRDAEIPKDYVTAYIFFKLASNNSSTNYVPNSSDLIDQELKLLSSLMTPSQLTEARQRLKEIKPPKPKVQTVQKPSIQPSNNKVIKQPVRTKGAISAFE